MGRSKSSSITPKKATEKQAMEVLEMATATLIWLAPTTKRSICRGSMSRDYYRSRNLENGRHPESTESPISSPVRLCYLFLLSNMG
jgi:hypothetical protein